MTARRTASRRRGRIGTATVAAGSLVVGALAFAPTGSAATTQVGLSGSTFEIEQDANIKFDGDATGYTKDWGNVDQTTGTDPTAGEIRKQDDPSGSQDGSFGEGTKEDTAVPTIVNGGIPPNKSDLKFFGVYQEGVGTAAIMHLYWTRVQDPSGTTNMDFEFNQSSTLSANGVTPVRTAGDLLITYDLSRGGTRATISKRTWSGSAWGPSTTFDGTDAVGTINTTLIPVGEDDGLGALDPRTFGEASIRLDKLLPTGTCTGFGSAYLKSRASDSFSAALKDFVPPVPVNVSNCGSLTIVKDAQPNDAQDFAFSTTGGLSPSTFSLDDDSDATLSNTRTYSGVPVGTYSVSETVPSGWDQVSATCSDGSPVTAISVAVGESVTCTFTNRKRGSITIVKDAVPNDAQDFAFTSTVPGNASFSLDDDANATLSNTNTISNVAPGAYSVTEAAVAGWDLTNLVCTDPDSGTTTSGSTASIDLDAGENVSCTFTNTKRGTITIVKDAVPDDAQDFAFTTTGTGLSGFSLDDDANGTLSNTFTSDPLAPGTYTVDEGDVAGWALTGLQCSDPSGGTTTNVVTGVVSVDLAAGEGVLCTYTNTKLGSVTIVKDASPNDAQDFAFTATGGLSPSSFSLDDDANGTLSDTRVFGGLLPGSFTVTESATSGWDLTGLSCVDPDSSSSVSVANRQASISLSAGEDITCTFTNTKRAGITITKVTVPGEDAQDFSFTTSGPGLSDFSLDTDSGDAVLGSSTTFADLVPGSYSVTEDGETGWDLTGLSCTDPSGGTTVNGATATIDLAAGESVSCTYTNTERGQIVVVKDAVPNDAQDFSFTGFASFALDDDSDPTLESTYTSALLPPGQYGVTESALAGWDLTDLACVDPTGDSVANLATATAAVTLGAGETVTCTFTNTKRGSITVVKDATPDDPQDFSFSGDLGTFLLDDDSNATLANSYTAGNLVPGTYAVTEGLSDDFDLTGLVCSDGSATDIGTRTATISLQPGESVTCTFTNRKKARISILKTDDDDPANPLSGAVFSVYEDVAPFDTPTDEPGAEDILAGVVASCTTLGDGTCTTDFDLTPGKAYWVVETTTPDGYATADPQRILATAGGTAELTFVDPRLFTVITIVCQQSDDSLYPSDVTLDAEGPKTSIGDVPAALDGVSEAELCGLGGARFTDRERGEHSGSVTIPQ